MRHAPPIVVDLDRPALLTQDVGIDALGNLLSCDEPGKVAAVLAEQVQGALAAEVAQGSSFTSGATTEHSRCLSTKSRDIAENSLMATGILTTTFMPQLSQRIA